MRIVAGSRKGLRLKTAKNRRVRPTTDSAKEFVFNVIGQIAANSSVLDIYAGTGSLGIEALSRGAARAVFIENSRQAQRLIKDNIQKAGFTESGELLFFHAKKALKHLGEKQAGFNLILADPPYENELAAQTLFWIEQYHLLLPGGLLVLEHGIRSRDLEFKPKFTLESQRQKGDTLFSFYRNDKF